VDGLKLAYIGEDVTYLLYAGRWFPVVNYGMDRFTAAINHYGAHGNRCRRERQVWPPPGRRRPADR